MFNRNTTFLLLVLLTIVVGGYLALSIKVEENSSEVAEINENLEEANAEAESEPLSGFSWRFVEADTNNPDGNHQTEVYLSANYEDGSRVEKLVDTVDGGCSELKGESYEGDVSNTGKVQCYYAGLGQQYRIVESSDSYIVERKLFEEALPDHTPLETEWEVMTEFEDRHQY